MFFQKQFFVGGDLVENRCFIEVKLADVCRFSECLSIKIFETEVFKNLTSFGIKGLNIFSAGCAQRAHCY